MTRYLVAGGILGCVAQAVIFAIMLGLIQT